MTPAVYVLSLEPCTRPILPSPNNSTSSAHVDGQSCGQAEWPILSLAWAFMRRSWVDGNTLTEFPTRAKDECAARKPSRRSAPEALGRRSRASEARALDLAT